MPAVPLSGCTLLAGEVAGALIVDEGFAQNDGKSDPFEKTEAGWSTYA